MTTDSLKRGRDYELRNGLFTFNGVSNSHPLV